MAGLFCDPSMELERIDLFGCSNTSHETGYLGTAVSREPDGADFTTRPNTHRTIESPPFSMAQKVTSSSARNCILASTATSPPFPSDGRTSYYLEMQLPENRSSTSIPQCSSNSSGLGSPGSAGSEHESVHDHGGLQPPLKNSYSSIPMFCLPIQARHKTPSRPSYK